MTLIFDHDLEKMTLAKYKKDQTCSDWTDITVFAAMTLVLKPDREGQ